MPEPWASGAFRRARFHPPVEHVTVPHSNPGSSKPLGDARAAADWAPGIDEAVTILADSGGAWKRAVAAHVGPGPATPRFCCSTGSEHRGPGRQPRRPVA